MDSNDLERERGITILAKTTGVRYHGVKINIVDTPGHSDFGGEVERALKIVDGVMLLVDASEGPLPQTRYVLMKALEAQLPPIVVINKIDRPDARIQEVLNEIYDLFIDLDATEDQLDFPVSTPMPSGHRQDGARRRLRRSAAAVRSHRQTHSGARRAIRTSILQMLLVANLDYSDYLGRLAIGRVFQRHPAPRRRQSAIASSTARCRRHDITKLYSFEGLKRVDETDRQPGRHSGDRRRRGHHHRRNASPAPKRPEPLPQIQIDEPTIAMTFTVNTSPFCGREGNYVTSRNLRDRLDKELLTNVSIKVEEAGGPDAFKVMGRGELQLAILIEMMRREGYELMVGKPEILTKTSNGKLHEPLELLVIDCPEQFLGVVMEKLGSAQGQDDEDGQPRLRPRAAGVPRARRAG